MSPKTQGVKVSPIVIDARKKGPKSPRQNGLSKTRKNKGEVDDGNLGGQIPPFHQAERGEDRLPQ